MIYEEFKSGILGEFKTKRDITVSEYKIEKPSYILEISEDYELYKKLIDIFEMVSIKYFNGLFKRLCQQYDIDYREEVSLENFRADGLVKYNGIEKVIEFKSFPTLQNKKFIIHVQKKINKPLIIVFLIKNNINGQNAIKKFSEGIDKDIEVECITFEELISYFMGENESLKFREAMSNFQEEIHKTIGYQITEILNEENLKKFIKKTENEILEFPYEYIKSQKTCNYIDSHEYDIIKKSYINKEKYKILLGKKDFAESFISSEWLYQNYIGSDELDNTFIVAGYLKSIEQILWDILLVMDYENRIYWEPIIGSDDKINNTLGSLEYLLNSWKNENLFNNSFDNTRNLMGYLNENIKVWRRNYRNGYFHKDNLNELEKVKIIRDETFYLYMLIIGSLSLSEKDIGKLMY